MTFPPRALPPCFFLSLFALLLGIALLRPIDHDEGQYVAAVALMRSGLPFRDFAYLQTPLQPLIFAPLAWLCDGWLFIALRLANALCATGAAALMFRAVRNVGGSRRGAWIATLALVTSHAFLFAATVARNDALPLLLHMVGLALVVDGISRGRSPVVFLFAGLMLGAAASAKISFGLPALSIGLFVLVQRHRLGLSCIVALAAGGMAGGLPTLILLAIAPEAAWFGIIDYSLKAPLEWQTLNGRTYMVEAPLTMLRLLRFLAQGMALVALVAWGASLLRRYRPSSLADRLLDWVILAGLIAAWLPRPIYVQYLLPLLPALFLRFGSMLEDRRWRRPAAQALFAFCMIAGITETLVRIVPNILRGHSPMLSATRDAHAIGLIVRGAHAIGPIVSLSPERAVDSGVPLDPRFAAGPFLFRTRALLTPAQQTSFHVLTAQNVAMGLTLRSPAAILTGRESASGPAHPHGLDAPLIAWAVAQRYRPVTLPSGEATLYLRPQRCRSPDLLMDYAHRGLNDGINLP